MSVMTTIVTELGQTYYWQENNKAKEKNINLLEHGELYVG